MNEGRPGYAGLLVVIGIVSPGAMGSAVGSALAVGGSAVVATIAGRSERTRRLAEAAGIDLRPTLADVVRAADVVLSIVPPGEARAASRAIAAAAHDTCAHPLVADLNAIAPATVRAIDGELREAGLDLVDGSISGPPPTAGAVTRVYLSGPRAHEVAALTAEGVSFRIVGAGVGAASAVKMSTASVYKGTNALLAQALLAAHANGVLEPVLEDLQGNWPDLVDGVEHWLQSAAAKAHRYVAEMEEIAATQAAAGLTPALFEAIADTYRRLAQSPLGRQPPEDVDPALQLVDVLESL